MKKLIISLSIVIAIIFCSISHLKAYAEPVKIPNRIYSILKDLGGVEPSIKLDKKVGIGARGDNLILKPSERIEMGNGDYAFLDSNNQIIRIKRTHSVRDVKSETKKKFQSTEELINYIKQNLVGKEYEMTEQYLFCEDTLALRFERVLFPGAFDSYDYISVRINVPKIELETFYKSEEKECIDKKKMLLKSVEPISPTKAIQVAMSRTEEDMEMDISKIATVKTDDNRLKLAYVVKSDEGEIYVDYYSGKIIGQEDYKAVRGGAVGALDVSKADDSISLAKSKLEAMGYNMTMTTMTSKFKTTVPGYLKNAFYTCAHGSATTISSRKDLNDSERSFSYNNYVPSGNYMFVFLDACNTASPQWKRAFGISNNSSGKVFLGWSSTVTVGASYNFCVDFWSYISRTSTLYEAVEDAADNGPGRPIQFTGDSRYNGYYY